MKANDAIDLLSGLAQGSRLRVFKELVRAHKPGANEGGLAAGNLAARVGLPAPTLSFHLKEMSRVGLVTSRKNGRSIIYKANLKAMNALIGYLLQDCCGGACGITLSARPQEELQK